MKREILTKKLEDIIYSGKEPDNIVQDLADFIISGFAQKKKNPHEEIINDTQLWIDEWLRIFPAGVKGGSKLLRSDPKICLKKMVVFRAEYPEFTVEQIIDATRNYIMEQAQNDYGYTMPAVNFIHHRDKGSELAARCTELINNKSETSVNTQKRDTFFI